MSDSEAIPAHNDDQPDEADASAPASAEPPKQPEREPEPEPQPDNRASVVVVGRNEDVSAICGRIDTAPTYAVVVHAPGGNRDLSREIGIRRLKRHAEDSGRTIAIATSSWSLVSRARQVRIPVARKPEHVRWDAGGRMVLRVAGLTLLLPPLGRYFQALAVIVAILAVAGLALTMGPSVNVVAYPPTEAIEQTISIVASPEFDETNVETLEVPAQNISSTRTITLAVPATGSVMVGVDPAVVTVTLFNETGEDIDLPSGTTFEASGNAPEFELQEDVTVPANGQLAVAAFALEPGTVGNIGPGTITGLAGGEPAGLRAENFGNAGGGADAPATAISPADVITIRELSGNLAVVDAIKRTLIEDRPRDAVFLDTAEVTVDPGEPSPPPGTIGDVLVMDVRVTVDALAVVDSVLDQLARTVLSEGQEGEFIPGSVTAVETGAREFDAETRTIETELLIRGEFARGFSSSDVKSAVSGKSEEDANATLAERYGIDDVEVDLSPGWAPRLPRFDFRIDVELRTRQSDAEENQDTATTGSGPTPSAGD